MAEPAEAPQIVGAPVIGIRTGTPVLHTLSVIGVRPMTFEAVGLPSGLSINAETGTISGSVTSAAEHWVSVKASNVSGVAERTLRLVVGNTLALTPPMGWNSYDSFDDSVREHEVLEQAQWLRDNLQPFGWDTVVVDFRWYDPDAPESDQRANNPQLTIDANGRLQPATNRFPSAMGGMGFKALADRVHALGLKFGIHIMRGIPRLAVNAELPIAGSDFSAQDAVRDNSDNGYSCVWNTDMYGVRGDTPAGKAWYNSIFRQYAEWGVDFVKVDDATKNRPAEEVEYHQTEVEAIRAGIQNSGRAMVLSLSPGETLISSAAHVSEYANMWRMSDDFWDRWENLDYTFTLAERWAKTGSSGHWPDADMLPVAALGPRCPIDGADRSTRFSQNEQVLMMTLWAILPSPYMLGANLVESAKDAFFMALVRNQEVLAVHQDELGEKGRRVVGDGSLQVWARDLSKGRTAVAFFNRGDQDRAVSVAVADLGISGRRLVREPWLRVDRPAVESSEMLTVTVFHHAAVLLVLSPDSADFSKAV